MSEHELVIGVGVGEVKLGQNVFTLKDVLRFVRSEKGESWAWDVYHYGNGDTKVYVEDGRVNSISCDSHCVYKNENLIGKRISEIESLLSASSDTVEPQDVIDEQQLVHSYYSKGLTVWTKDEIAVTIQCGDLDDE